ncbi:MAG: von Willebrand factor type A domain-containing protein [Verrucomicrobia bacterium]|nr:von Willebrand factor type A domain-containing protein [Verrucomicrobiota bacterium]
MPSLTTIGDEPLEARIVAWVLGEASAFEEAELERLCAERPELVVFRRRMRALHGLLTEAEAAQPDPTWKLPPEKRKVLDDLFGAPVRLTNKPATPRKRRSTWNWTLSALAACLIALLVAGAMFSMKGIGHSGKLAATEPRGPMTQNFFATDPQADAAGEGRSRALEESAPESRFSRGSASVRAPAKPSAPASVMDRESLARADASFSDSPAPPASPPPGSVPLGATGCIVGDGIAKADTPAPPTDADFGGGDDFGKGWGGGTATPAQPPIPGQPISGKPATSTLSDLAAKIPTTEDLPVAGKLITGTLDQNQPVSPGEPHFNMVDALTEKKPAAEDNLELDGYAYSRTDSDRISTLQPPSLSTSRFQTTAPEPQADLSGLATRGSSQLPQSNGTVAGAKIATATVAGIAGGGTLDSKTTTLNLETPARPAETAPQLPSLSNRSSWHCQDEGTKGNANLSDGSAIVPESAALLTETTSGGLKADLSKSLAEREMVRRQESVVESERLLADGRKAREEGRLAEADDFIRSAGEKLPDAPLLETRKKQIEELRSTVAKELGDRQPADPANQVSLGLHTADSAYNLGKYDQATQEYEKVLRADPNNEPARRGMETIAKAKSDYYRAAYDQTRAELLMDVDKAWDQSLPNDRESLEKAVAKQEQKIERSKMGGMADSITRSDASPDSEEARSFFEVETAKLAALKAKLASVTPKPAPPVPADELSAESEPYSTFSLSVSDASFKTAHAALMQNNVPDPAGIRVEQFYNAMDYGDPYPAAGEPVAAAIEQAAHPVIPGRNLVRVALRTAAEGRAASQPLCLTLLIDQSGSMARDDRRQALARALSELATLLTPADRVTVIGFSLTSHMLADRLPGNEAAKLASLVNMDASEGGTNLESALVLGKEVAETRKIPGAQNRIVLFTDGAANLGNADPAKLALTIQQARQSGLSFDVAGLGTSELNDRLLAELARHGNGRFHVVDAAADAPDTFAKQLAGAFRPAAENVKVQVRFNPSRVGGYKLLGFEEHRLNREDFHNDAVDAAELAAAEAGVALYQIEPLPNGSGDIGEVSVRFRDTATGSMVERSWNIAYDSGAPAFDRANPSLQLAGMAMLAAEKLRGGPLAAATDFTTLTTPLTTIRQTFPKSTRAAELMEMIGKLR